MSGPAKDTQAEEARIALDVASVGRIEAIPSILQIVCDQTRMRFAAVARVSDDRWVACAVRDEIAFGLKPGDELPIASTLCRESRAARAPIRFDQASRDEKYRDHHTPRLYGIESYISVPIILGDGEYFGNLCAIDPLPARVESPEVAGMFAAFADLIARQLDLERRDQQLGLALAEARTDAHQREQFIATLGHDLRGPLSAISNVAHILQAGTTDAAIVRRCAAHLLSATGRMAHMVEDLVDFARGRLGGGMQVSRLPVGDMAEALREVVREAREAHPGREIADEIALPAGLPVDRVRLQQVVSNLLGNALNYGAPGRPVAMSAGVQGGELLLAVQNHGEPIAPEHLPHLFKAYWRPPGAPASANMGLGLHICQQIAQAHGGRIEVSSSLEEGTRFLVRLPVTP